MTLARQQVAIFDNLSGEIRERRLQHRSEAEQFYRSLAGQEVRVGMDACGHYPWFERMLEEIEVVGCSRRWRRCSTLYALRGAYAPLIHGGAGGAWWSFRFRVKSKIKSKVKSCGQECPLHTGNGKRAGLRRADSRGRLSPHEFGAAELFPH